MAKTYADPSQYTERKNPKGADRLMVANSDNQVTEFVTIKSIIDGLVPKPTNDSWFNGDMSLVVGNAKAESVLKAIKTIFFGFPEGKPSWWDSRTPRIRAVNKYESPWAQAIRLYFAAANESTNDDYTADLMKSDGYALNGISYLRGTKEVAGEKIEIYAIVENGQLDDMGDTDSVVISSVAGNSLLMFIEKRFASELWFEEDNEKTEVSSYEIGASPVQEPRFNINHLITYGQSNSIGQQSFPPLTTQSFRGNLMIGENVYWAERVGTSFEDLVALTVPKGDTPPYGASSSSLYAESPAISAANVCKRMLDRATYGMVDNKMLVTCAAQGGLPIEYLRKGYASGYYDRITAAATQAKLNADAEGKTIGCPIVVWNQGEASYRGDFGGTTDKNVYKGYLKEIFDDITADVKQIYGQEDAPIFVINQTYRESSRDQTMQISMAQLELANEFNNIVLAGPEYIHYPSGRGNHKDPNNCRWSGEFIAKAYIQSLRGNKFIPLQPQKIMYDRNKVHIDMFVPVPPMKFDAYTTHSNNNHGFVLSDENGALSISQINIKGNRIEIITTKQIQGILRVGYGRQLGGDTGGGNLRDSDRWESFYYWEDHDFEAGYIPKLSDGVTQIKNLKMPMYNWCVNFYYEVNGVLEVNI